MWSLCCAGRRRYIVADVAWCCLCSLWSASSECVRVAIRRNARVAVRKRARLASRACVACTWFVVLVASVRAPAVCSEWHAVLCDADTVPCCAVPCRAVLCRRVLCRAVSVPFRALLCFCAGYTYARGAMLLRVYSGFSFARIVWHGEVLRRSIGCINDFFLRTLRGKARHARLVLVWHDFAVACRTTA